MGQTVRIPREPKLPSFSVSSTSLKGSPEVLTPRALREWVAQEGLPRYRAEQVLRWIFQRGARSFAEMTDLPRSLREALACRFSLALAELSPAVVQRSADGTRKLLFALDDKNRVESVLIPDPPRLTLCISSQAGCAMACEFCATARLGFLRNLSAMEIAGQVLAARRELAEGERITNIVFMGMGEPLHNYDHVVEVIDILTAPWGFDMSGRRITVSTAGLVPQLERLARSTPVNIAVSLTATTNELRDQLMPVNRKYPIERLIAACRKLPIAQRRRITFEYVMLGDVNDSSEDAARLVKLLRGVRAKVNLIPFNPFFGSGFEPSSDETIRRFQEQLLAAGVNATVRISRGRDIQAACGQLAGSA